MSALKMRNELVFSRLVKSTLPTTWHKLWNFGKGGMKKLVDDIAVSHAISIVKAATYGLHFGQLKYKSKKDKDHDNGDVWSSSMELIMSRKVLKEVLQEARDCIRLEIDWEDPIDSLSVHAYNEKCQNNKAQVKKKHRRETGDDGPSKRVT